MSTPQPGTTSIGAPLKDPVFRRLWIANFVSNLGTITQAVAAGWLMTSLTHSPLVIGLVMTAMNLPIFILGLPAGVMADLFDRRKILIIAQCLMMGAAFAMMALTALGLMTSWRLLFFLALLGIGSAFHLPTWMALLQDIVAEKHLTAAVSLNSIGFNLARSLGPSLAAYCVDVIGIPCAFLCDALSYLVVLFGLVKIPNEKLPPPPTEGASIHDFFKALLEIKNFVMRSMHVPGILLRLSFFIICNAGVLGLLPFIVREKLHLDVNSFGIFLSSFGIASVLGALFLPRLRQYFSVDAIVAGGVFLSAISIFFLAYSRTIFMVTLGMFLFGVAWILVLVNYNVSLQLAAPPFLKGRMISLYVVFFQGGVGLGGALGGWLAERLNYHRSLILEASVVAASLLLIPFFSMREKNSR